MREAASARRSAGQCGSGSGGVASCCAPSTRLAPRPPHPARAARVRALQDKFAQKQHFTQHGVPLPEFREIKSRACMEATGGAYGYPFMLKIKRCAPMPGPRCISKFEL